jgi:hypothetical protein
VPLAGAPKAIEGIDLGRVDGEYVIAVPTYIEDVDRTFTADNTISIRVERVILREIL